MSLLNKVKTWSDNLYIKKLAKPLYLPTLLKIKYLYKNKVYQNNGVATLLTAHKALNEIDTFFWLDFGTLLGIVRDGELIGHDSDIDLGIKLSDHTDLISQTLSKYGFKLYRRIIIENGAYGIEESYSYKGVSLDLFYYTIKGQDMYCHLFPEDEQKKRFIKELHMTYGGFKKIEYKGHQFNVPDPSEARLIDTYGIDYEIPDKNWYTPDSALNSKIIDKKISTINFN